MSPDPASPYNILVIDDDLTFTKMLQLRLKSFMPQASVRGFETLEQARHYMREEPEAQIDLVVLDEHLPDGRGIELLQEGWFENLAVLSVSSDTAPEIPGALMQAGAAYFLSKLSISEPLFKPLVLGLIDRNKLQHELTQARIKATIIDTVRTLVGTLRHEINNPLGAVLGAAYLLRSQTSASEEQRRAAELVESSGQRIKHVLDQLTDTVELKPVTKANQTVFHIPGDKPWETGHKQEKKSKN